MTRVRMARFPNRQWLTVEGHQDGEAAGNNIYCAAISAIVATLVNAMILEEGVKHEVRGGNGAVVVAGPRNKRVDAFYDAAMAGFRGFQQEYPDRMVIEE